MARSASLYPMSEHWGETWNAAQSSVLSNPKNALTETNTHIVAPVAVAVADGGASSKDPQLTDGNLRPIDVAAATRHDGLISAVNDGARGAGSFEITDSDIDIIVALDMRWNNLDDSQPDGAVYSGAAVNCDGNGGSGGTASGGCHVGDLRRSSSSASSVDSSDGGAGGSGGNICFDMTKITGTRKRKLLADSCDLFPSFVHQNPSAGFEPASETQSPAKRKRREFLPSLVTDRDVDLWLVDIMSVLRRQNDTGYATFAPSSASAFSPEHIDLKISLQHPSSQGIIFNDAVLLLDFSARDSSVTSQLYADGCSTTKRLDVEQSKGEADDGAYVALLEVQIAAMVPEVLEEMDMAIMLDLDACDYSTTNLHLYHS